MLRPGKLPRPLLERLLAGRAMSAGVLVGPGVGLDGAVLDVGGTEPLVAVADPITFASDEIGWYAVHVNANDVACMGGRPRWFLATVLLPEGAEEAEAERIFDQMDAACREVGAGLVGGHTEVTPGLGRPIVCGTMLGSVSQRVSAAGALPGDVLLLTKGVAIEATAILARERGEALRGRVEEAVLARARAFLHDPGLSVVRDARVALRAGRVHALHDPTEGGLVEGVRELCAASGAGVLLYEEAIPILEETRLLAEPFGIDPLGAIASGALLIAAPRPDAGRICAALREEGIDCVEIGEIRPAGEGMRMVFRDGEVGPLPAFAGDEIGKIF